MKIAAPLDRIERYRHGAPGLAVGIGLTLFGVAWKLLEASGVGGGFAVVRDLFLASAAIAASAYVLLLHRQLERLKHTGGQTSFPEARETMETAIATLDPPKAEIVRTVVQRYEDTIKELQDQLRPMTFPLRPVLVEGGTFLIGVNGGEPDEVPAHEVQLDSFLMDPVPVTNQEFAVFLSVPENKQWTAEGVYGVYGLPYYLCEFSGARPPADKWDHSVVWVSWFAAAAFCNWRSPRDGREPVYEFVEPEKVVAEFGRNGWRLPTEAEWERAAREASKAPAGWAASIRPPRTTANTVEVRRLSGASKPIGSESGNSSATSKSGAMTTTMPSTTRVRLDRIPVVSTRDRLESSGEALGWMKPARFESPSVGSCCLKTRILISVSVVSG